MSQCSLTNNSLHAIIFRGRTLAYNDESNGAQSFYQNNPSTNVIQSSKMSLEIGQIHFSFSWFIQSIRKIHIYDLQSYLSQVTPIEIGRLVPKISAVERMEKTIGNNKVSALFGYILNSEFENLTPDQNVSPETQNLLIKSRRFRSLCFCFLFLSPIWPNK